MKRWTAKGTTAYWAVRFETGGEVRITTTKVATPLQAVDAVLGTRYSVDYPMVIDVLHDFGELRVKAIATTTRDLQSAAKRQAAIASPEGWVKPAYSPELVARARRAARVASTN